MLFCMFCLLFYVIGVEKWNLFFFQMILEHLHFCLASHACVSHLLRGQPYLLECYYRNCLIEKHMCLHPVSEWSVFFTLQCELFRSCNVANNASLVSARTEGRGLIKQMWTGLDRGKRRGGGVPKIPKFVRTSFMADPYLCWIQKNGERHIPTWK